MFTYGVESVPKITGLRGPPAFRWSPTFSRPHGFRVLDIPHVNALSVPKILLFKGHLLFKDHLLFEGHIVFAGHIVLEDHLLIYFLFLRLIGSLMYN